MHKSNKGITLIALVITIIVLLILAGITISLVIGDNGILEKASGASEKTKMESAREKVILMLGEYQIDKYIKEQTSEDPLYDFFDDKLSKGDIEDIIDNTKTEIIIQVDGYEFTIDKETLEIIGDPVKVRGVKPIIEVQVTKVDGTVLVGGESQKALTVTITNISEYGSNYTIEVKDKDGNILTKETNVVGSLTGQASYKIAETGKYTIVVTGTKDGITRKTLKIETITIPILQFTKAYGVIEIVWLDTDNNAISSPISPAGYLGGMTPIKYDGTNWVPADITNSGNDWYHYVAQTGTNDGKTSNWANAKKSSGANEVYFVWIPRYAYKITYFDTLENKNAYRENSSNKTGIVGYSTIEGMINITSGTPKLVDGTGSSNVTGTVKTEGYKEYIPHPAFEFDSPKAGIWVGKYEPSGSTNLVTIKPNASSLRNITVSNIVTACQSVKATYALAGDTHMMKNTQWGAVSYLAESKYGRNGTEIAINTSKYITGGANYISNAVQSTTGNINGIYDMSGGAWEYVAGYIDNSHVNNGYNTNLLDAVKANSKYANVYKSTNDSPANNYEENKGMKGDALYETSNSYSGANSWYADNSNFSGTSGPIFLRSGNYYMGNGSGAFTFSCSAGTGMDHSSFRVVLVP